MAIANPGELGLTTVHDAFKKSVADAEKEVSDAIEKLQATDGSNPTQLLALQQNINVWTVAINTASSTVKALKDACSSITQKM